MLVQVSIFWFCRNMGRRSCGIFGLQKYGKAFCKRICFVCTSPFFRVLVFLCCVCVFNALRTQDPVRRRQGRVGNPVADQLGNHHQVSRLYVVSVCPNVFLSQSLPLPPLFRTWWASNLLTTQTTATSIVSPQIHTNKQSMCAPYDHVYLWLLVAQLGG